MTKLMNIRQARIMALSVDLSFLLIHVALLLLFRRFGVTPMVWFNVCSIICYVILPLFIARNYLRTFCVVTYLEVVMHMSLAVYFTGWDSGFQVTLIGICILTSYSEYLGRYLKVPYLHATPLSAIGMAAYIIMCIVDYHHEVMYPLPPAVSYYMRLGWGIVTFSIMLFFLYIFVRVSAGTEELLSKEVDHDQLTGLPNRYGMWDHMNRMDRDRKLDNRWLAMLDIDDFKKINDTYGHNCGDEILMQLANILQNNGHGWKVSRWGGEEFLIVGKIEPSYEESAIQMANLLTKVSDTVFTAGGQHLSITMTAGMAMYEGESIRDWIGVADSRLYEGKRSGKNRVVS